MECRTWREWRQREQDWRCRSWSLSAKRRSWCLSKKTIVFILEENPWLDYFLFGFLQGRRAIKYCQKTKWTLGLSALIKVTALKSYLKLINISALKSPKDDYSWQWRLLKLWILIPSPFFFSHLFQGIEPHCGDRCIEVSPQWPIWSLIRNQKVNNLFKIRTSSSWVQLDSKNAPRHTPYVLNPSNLSLVKC